MDESTAAWWSLLRAVALLNAAAWALSALLLAKRRPRLEAEVFAARRLQLLLSAAYVAGCAWRSLLPVFDVQRLVLVDSAWSSVVVGRSVATVAELCFAAQWALLLREASEGAGCRGGRLIALALVPLIAIAECCSWYAVLTLSNLGHVLEESLWGLCAALWVASVGIVARRAAGRQRALLLLGCVAGALYVAYMFRVDVPMYWARWLADEAAHRSQLSLVAGIADASARWVISHRWADWKSEVVWMTAYFSVAVWLSIALVHAPRVVPGGRAVSQPA